MMSFLEAWISKVEFYAKKSISLIALVFSVDVMWGSIDMISRKWHITIDIYWLRIGVRSHIFLLSEPYTKVSKETKSPTIGMKLLNALTTTFIASSRLSHWHCFFVYYLLTDVAFSLELITKIILSPLQECPGQDALKRCYYPGEHRLR